MSIQTFMHPEVDGDQFNSAWQTFQENHEAAEDIAVIKDFICWYVC